MFPRLSCYYRRLRHCSRRRHPKEVLACSSVVAQKQWLWQLEMERRSSSSSSSSSEKELPKNRSVRDVPSHANVVIVGGGIIGTSVAYHLGKLGVTNVVLLEQNQLTSGTTWHAAGLINTFGSMSYTATKIRQYTRNLYANVLPQETNVDTGFQAVGFIELACTPDRLYYYRKVAAFNRYCGVQVQEIPPNQVQELFPLVDISDVLAGFYVPTDGRVNPVDVTMALKQGAKQNGVAIYEHVAVERVVTDSASSNTSLLPRVVGVQLDNGTTLEAQTVVNCTGMWARQLPITDVHATSTTQVSIPNQAAEHYYMITDTLPENIVDPTWPVVEDSSKCVYIRPEGKGLLLGLFESEGGAPWSLSKVPSSFAFGELSPDWDRMTPYLEMAMERLLPNIRDEIRMKQFFCGPESFAPDNHPVLGEAPFVKNYYVAAGMNSLGITTGGGIGSILAQWIHNDGHPPINVDVTAMNIDRFHPYQCTPEYRSQRVGEALGTTYKVHYPDFQYQSARNAKQSVLHDRLIQQGAYFKETSGWESPSWYKSPLTTTTTPVSSSSSNDTKQVNQHHIPHHQPSFQRESWFPYWEEEHVACRDSVALFDMSFMSKFLVQGIDAGSFLNSLSTANVDRECGIITYTQWLNEQGTLEADLTVTKLASDQFLVVATDTMHNHVHSHMKKRLRKNIHAFCTDVTGKYTQLNIQGPNSRALLQEVTTVDMSSENFPFRSVQELDIGFANALCMRITYVGELGYELLIPVEQAAGVYDKISKVGPQFGLRHAGLRALGSLRLEKAYRDYGHDIDGTDTVLEAGLGFTCDLDKENGFIGKDHVIQQKLKIKERGGLTRKMAQVLVTDPEPLLCHGEILWRNGQRITEIRSASYGHTLKGAVGLAMLEQKPETNDEETKTIINKEFIATGDWEVEIANEKYPCQLSFAPMYDPKSSRVKV